MFAMRSAAEIWDAHTSFPHSQAAVLTRQVEALISTTGQSESDPYATWITFNGSKSPFEHESLNLEALQLVWLTSDGSDNANIPNIDFIRLIVDDTKIFSDRESCLDHIQKTSTVATFFVCSIHQCMTVLEIIEMKNIEAIHLYNNGNEEPPKHEWISQYRNKIKSVGVSFDQLLFDLNNSLETCIKSYETIGIFQSLKENTTENYCSWWIKFLDIVLYLPYTKKSSDQFIITLKPCYNGNKPKLDTLEKFNKTYDPRDAAEWYTKDSFLYRLVNHAMRRRNVELTFLIGFYVQDLYRQVAQEYEKQKLEHFKEPILKVFRVQKIGTREHISITSSLNEIIVLHSFFSTSLDREAVLGFLDPHLRRNSTQQNVLFEIEIDLIRRIKSRPYADITHLSTKIGEKEVLFIPGIQFRIYNISYDENIHCWIVKMLMISNDDKDILVIEDAISARKKLKNLFNALFYNRKLPIPIDKWEIMFTHFDKLLPPHDKAWVKAIHLHIEGRSDRTLAYSNYSQALKMWSSFMTDDSNADELNCFIDISRLHKDFAYYYGISDDYNIREKHLDQADDCLRKALQRVSTDTERVLIEDELVDLYNQKLHGNNKKHGKHVSKVIRFKELSLQRTLNFYSVNDIAIVSHLVELAKLHDSINECDAALKYFQRALEIHLQQVEPDYINIITICDNIARIYIENKHDAKSALLYQLIDHQCTLKQEKIVIELHSSRNSYLADNDMVAKSHVKLGSLYTKLTQYDLARENLTTASKLYTYYKLDDKDVKLGEIEEKQADICRVLHQYTLAHQHLTAALELYEKKRLSLKGKVNVDVQNDDDDNSLRRAIETAMYVSSGAGEITEKIAVIEKKLRKMKTLLKKEES